MFDICTVIKYHIRLSYKKRINSRAFFVIFMIDFIVIYGLKQYLCLIIYY